MIRVVVALGKAIRVERGREGARDGYTRRMPCLRQMTPQIHPSLPSLSSPPSPPLPLSLSSPPALSLAVSLIPHRSIDAFLPARPKASSFVIPRPILSPYALSLCRFVALSLSLSLSSTLAFALSVCLSVCLISLIPQSLHPSISQSLDLFTSRFIL
jgi:hypothetical protein